MPATGFGFAYSQKNEPASSGPPFPLNSADNGLSVDAMSGEIVWGNDFGTGAGGSAMLLNNREIDMNTFSMFLQDFGGGLLAQIGADSIQLQSGLTGFNTVTTADQYGANGPTGVSFLAPDRLSILGINTAILTGAAELDLFSMSAIPPQIQFAMNGGFINYLGQVNDEFMITINGEPGIGQRVLSIDRTTQLYQFGDIDGFGVGTKIVVDDPNQAIDLDSTFVNINGRLLVNTVDDAVNLVQVGGGIRVTDIVLPQATISSTGVDVVIGTTAAATIRLLPLGNDAFFVNTQMGRVNLGNGGNFSFLSLGPAGIVNIFNVPNFATNALAIAGGLVVGDVYRTAGAVMIVI